MECVKEEGHNYGFVGYMVVCEEIEKKEKVGSGTGGLITLKMPEHFSAKIEVWQCVECGHIKLSPAVYTRI